MIFIKRAIIGLITGLVGGALFGAVVFIALFLPGYLAGHSFFDKLKHLIGIAGFIGAEVGFIVGGIIGLIIGVFGFRRLYGALTGLAVILILSVSLVGPAERFKEPNVLLTILSAVAAATLGAVIAAIINRMT